MKKIICLVLIFTMMLTACSKWDIKIVDPTKPVEDESELVISEEKHISNITSEKAETKNLTEDGFANLRGSSIAFQLIDNSKALFFSYKEGDPFEGGGVSVRVFLYDYESNKTEFIKELSFSDYKNVSVYERNEKVKVVFANKFSAKVLSIDTETFETETEELENIPGNISRTGLWALAGEHLTVRDIEDNKVVSVIETGEIKANVNWSSNCEYLHVQKDGTEEIYSISGEKMAEIKNAEIRNWCAESKYFTYCKISEDYSWEMWLLDVSTGEQKEVDVEIEIDPDFFLPEKDFAVFKNGGKLCLKEYSTGNVFEIAEDFGEYNYYEELAYDKENETIIAAAYKDGATEVWKIKLEWKKGAGEKVESADTIVEEEREEQEVFPENTYFKDFCILLIRGDNNEKYYIELPESEIKKLFAEEEFNNLAVPSDRSISGKNEKIATFYDKNRNHFDILVYEDDLLLMVNKDGRDENFSMPKTAEAKIRALTEKIVSEYIESGKISPNNAKEVFPVPGMEVFDVIRLFKENYSPTVELNYEEQTELLKILNPKNWTETETLPEKLEHKEIDPENTFFSESLSHKNVLYIYRYEGKCYIRQEWGIALDGKRCWVADLETADAIEAFRLLVYENFKNDGRWPYLDEEEEPYLKNPGVYNEEEFLKELDIFIDCVSGEHGAGTEFTAQKTGLYAITKAYRDGIEAGEVFEYDSDGRVLVSEKAVNEAAKYGFGIREYSKYIPSENGKYAVPFDWPYKNPKVESVVINGNYVYCTVNFYDLGDTEFEKQLEQKEYTFLMFEAKGKTRYRLVSMYYIYGGYGF